jgi:hypothetical protein
MTLSSALQYVVGKIKIVEVCFDIQVNLLPEFTNVSQIRGVSVYFIAVI